MANRAGERRAAPRFPHRGGTAAPAPIVGSAPPTHPRHRHCGPARDPTQRWSVVGKLPTTTSGVAATTRQGTTQRQDTPRAVGRQVAAGSRREAVGAAWQAGHGDQPGQPTGHQPPGHLPPAPARPPGTPQLDRRVPCINIQPNGQVDRTGHRFGFWNATTLSTARSSLASLSSKISNRPELARNAQRRRSVCIKEACRG